MMKNIFLKKKHENKKEIFSNNFLIKILWIFNIKYTINYIKHNIKEY